MKAQGSKMKESRAPGYSGTPLAKKLGIKSDSRVLLIDAPGSYAALLGEIPKGIKYEPRPSAIVDVVHLFVTRKQDLARQLKSLRKQLRPDAVVWVSWPKKAAKVATDVTEDTIRQIALPQGYVDIKVCAVSDIWSGLKLVVRKELR
jgi:hypothetical protein